jgi:hypothetical protein
VALKQECLEIWCSPSKTWGNLSVWFNKEIKPPEDVLKANLAQDLVELALIHLII